MGRALDEVRTRRRLYVVAAVLGVMALLPLVKLVGVQLTDASALAARGRKQGRSEVTIGEDGVRLADGKSWRVTFGPGAARSPEYKP